MGDASDKIEVRRVRFSPAAFLRPVLDVLYPPCCAVCGVRMAVHRALCGACWSRMRFIERPYCDILGIPFAKDPGEGMVSALAIAEPPVFDRLRAVVLHEGPARHLVHGLKYRDRTDLALMMAAWMWRAGRAELEACDAILPVPLHWTRMMARRFNQAAELGRHLAHQSGKPMLSGALVRTKRTRRQVGLMARGREDNVRAAFRVTKGEEHRVFGRRLVLVDDVFTTGATVSAAARALKRAGAADVTVLTFAMALAEPI